MARTVKDVALSTRTARARLKVSGKPYYRAIDPGLHLGYRKGKTGGRWVVRWYRGEEQYEVETIGTADDTADADGVAVFDFAQAQTIARAKRTEKARAAAGLPATESGPYTVRHALEDYIDHLSHTRKSAPDARNRADELIIPKLGHIDVAKLTADQIRKWLRDLAATPPRLRTRKAKTGTPPVKQNYRKMDEDDPEAARRRKASANRTLTTLKAALNHAWREKKAQSDDAWRRVEPYENVDAARLRYLKLAEAQRLINASDEDFRKLVRAALQTGCRYGELCRLDVHDFDAENHTLRIRESKSGKSRHIVLTEEGAAFFETITLGRAGNEPMLIKHRVIPGRTIDGERQPDTVTEIRWGESHQARPMVEACKRAKILPAIDFHTLRHTYASLSVMAGVPLMVIAKQLGHADTRMVEKHYGHLAPSYVADAVRAAAPRFGAVEKSNLAGMGKPK
jgi:integrase